MITFESLQSKRKDLVAQGEQYAAQAYRINGAVALLDDLILEMETPESKAAAGSMFGGIDQATHPYWKNSVPDTAPAAAEKHPESPIDVRRYYDAPPLAAAPEMLQVVPEDGPALCNDCLTPDCCRRLGCAAA